MMFSCSREKTISLRETYSAADPNPFGAMTAKRLYESYYPAYYIVNVKEAIADNPMLRADTHSVYFSVSKNLFLSEVDVETLLSSVYSGNVFFFSSAYFDSTLMNALYCKVMDDGYSQSGSGGFTDARVKLMPALVNRNDSAYGYFYYPFLRFFTEVNSSYGRIIAYNGDGNPNGMVLFWGKGKLFLHTEPRAFSNYFLLSKNNYRYMENFLKVLGDSPQHVFWDDYYLHINHKPGVKSAGTFSEILKHPPLAWAFYLMLALLAFYLLFNAKRKQRQIRVIPSNTNSSVAFSETIARLYMQEGDHKAIALKMTAHFHEFLRTNYYLNANMSRNNLINALSSKSGVSESNTRALFNAMDKLTNAVNVTDDELFRLHNQIQEFYNKRI